MLSYFEESQTDPEKADVMNLDKWNFWVFKKDEMMSLMKGRKALTVAALQTSHKPITVFQLKAKILGR